MKRLLRSDWDYQEGNDEVNAFKDLMKTNMDYQDNGQVGIFWYDKNKNELFGVRSADVEDVSFYQSSLFSKRVKTCRPLHYSVWDKEHHRKKDPRFNGDYTLIPRGRVFFVEDKGFVVTVGDWINEYPQAKEEILFEFNLPKDTEFLLDDHWNEGHGWSDKFV